MEEHSERAAAAGTADGSRKAFQDGQSGDNTKPGLPAQFPALRQPWNGPPPNRVTFIRARIGDEDGPVKVFRGRVAWCLASLLQAGAAGITSVENPAPRLSDYVFKCRKAGLVINTADERHGGPFRGNHGRYRLMTSVTVLDVEAVGDAA